MLLGEDDDHDLINFDCMVFTSIPNTHFPGYGMSCAVVHVGLTCGSLLYAVCKHADR